MENTATEHVYLAAIDNARVPDYLAVIDDTKESDYHDIMVVWFFIDDTKK